MQLKEDISCRSIFAYWGFHPKRSLSGNDIKKLFAKSAAYFWPVDQTQIYRTLKNLEKNGMIRLKEQKKGETVDRKIYAITDKGRAENAKQIQQNTIDDFISRDAFLMQLFFSGALGGEQLEEFLDTQLGNIEKLEQRLIDNYNENLQ